MRCSKFAMIVLATVLLVGCKDDAPDSTNKSTTAQQADAGNADAATKPQIRMAFGIPLPPEGKLQNETETEVAWYTKMSVKELEEYYNGRLTDYEVIREGTTLRIIGLRSQMGSAYATHLGRDHMPVEMLFYSSEPAPMPYVAEKLDLAGKEVEVVAKPVTDEVYEQNKKGKPVTARLPNGKLMAPGAVWGEPYMPPEGSYYHKRKFKPNWGRPFGDWRVY